MCIGSAARPRPHRFLQPEGEPVPSASPGLVLTSIARRAAASVTWLSEASGGASGSPPRCGGCVSWRRLNGIAKEKDVAEAFFDQITTAARKRTVRTGPRGAENSAPSPRWTGRYTSSMPPRANAGASDVAIAGAGPVAQAFGRALQECGIGIGCIASRNLSHAKAAAVFIGGSAHAVPYRDIPLHASHVLVAVSDRAIAPVAEELASGNGRIRVALHTCGSHGPEVLAPLQAVGVSCGSIHPLQTIRDASRGAAALRSAAFSVSGDSHALDWAEEIATTLGGQVLHIKPGDRISIMRQP